MTIKPDDIPQDVWAAADAALDVTLCNCIEASGTSEQLRIDSTEPIARAILAERERCLTVVATAPLSNRSSEPATSNKLMCDWIAAAIRKGSRQLTPGKP